MSKMKALGKFFRTLTPAELILNQALMCLDKERIESKLIYKV